jgi:hypothetical protein
MTNDAAAELTRDLAASFPQLPPAAATYKPTCDQKAVL